MRMVGRALVCVLFGVLGCKSKGASESAPASTPSVAVSASPSASSSTSTIAVSSASAPASVSASASASSEPPVACDPAKDPGRALDLATEADKALAKKSWQDAIDAYGRALAVLGRCPELAPRKARLLMYRAFAQLQRKDVEAAQRDLDEADLLVAKDREQRAKLEYYRGLLADARGAQIEAVERYARSQTLSPSVLAQGALDARTSSWEVIDVEATTAPADAEVCAEEFCVGSQGWSVRDAGARLWFAHTPPHWEGDWYDVFGCGLYVRDLMRRESSVEGDLLVLREDAPKLQMTTSPVFHGEPGAKVRWEAGRCTLTGGSYRLSFVDREKHRLVFAASFDLSVDGKIVK
jgi:hypothetical protein